MLVEEVGVLNFKMLRLILHHLVVHLLGTESDTVALVAIINHPKCKVTSYVILYRVFSQVLVYLLLQLKVFYRQHIADVFLFIVWPQRTLVLN